MIVEHGNLRPALKAGPIGKFQRYVLVIVENRDVDGRLGGGHAIFSIRIQSLQYCLRKVGTYPRQNALVTALRELSKLERTLFLFQRIQDVESRPAHPRRVKQRGGPNLACKELSRSDSYTDTVVKLDPIVAIDWSRPVPLCRQ